MNEEETYTIVIKCNDAEHTFEEEIECDYTKVKQYISDGVDNNDVILQNLIDEYEWDINDVITDNFREDVEDSLVDPDPIPSGDFANYDQPDQEYAMVLLREKFAELKITADLYIGEKCACTQTLNKWKCLECAIESVCDAESGLQVIGRNLAAQLKRFFEKGKWFVALAVLSDDDFEPYEIKNDVSLWPEPTIIDGRIVWLESDEDGYNFELEPIIYFGCDEDDIIPWWIVSRERKIPLGLQDTGDACFNWERLLHGDDDNIAVWAFETAGYDSISKGNFYKDCPIKLGEEDIVQFAVNYQKKYMDSNNRSLIC